MISKNKGFNEMPFSKVYPHYVNKVIRKGRTIEELHQVIHWLTGFDHQQIEAMVHNQVTFETFFQHAMLHKNAQLIKGVICGIRVEEIVDPMEQKVRYLDKLVDELAKGKAINKILRKTI